MGKRRTTADRLKELERQKARLEKKQQIEKLKNELKGMSK